MPNFLDIDELRTFLNATRGSAADLEQVDACAEAACDAVEDLCGPVMFTTVTDEHVEASRGRFTTDHPVESVQSAVTLSTGSVVDVTGWRPSGRVVAGVTVSGELLVTYTTGYAVAPPWAETAAKIIARHLWRTQIGPMARNEAQQGSGFLVPNQAMALLEPHVTPAGLS